MFIKYPKIKRLGHEDTEGILEGIVIVQEKIDGANTSIWIENGEIKCGSRTRILDEGFNGFVDYAKNHEGIKQYLEQHPTHRLYGEWLVRHTISYNETAYQQFYLFDILEVPENLEEPTLPEEMTKKEREEGRTRELVRQCEWLPLSEVYAIGEAYEINTPHLFAVLNNPSPESIDEHVGKTMIGDKGEGVVVKNSEFINKWGARVCAKVVTQEFKEDNAIVFGGNNKHSDTYIEMKMVNEFMTMARVRKVMQKLEPIIDKKLDLEHTGRIIQTAYHDMFEEELWEFVKKNKKIDFGQLQKLSSKKAAKIYHDILNNKTSVAYENNSK